MEFKWDKDTRPEYLYVGSKMKMQAKIGYSDDPTFIVLKPTKTWGK